MLKLRPLLIMHLTLLLQPTPQFVLSCVVLVFVLCCVGICVKLCCVGICVKLCCVGICVKLCCVGICVKLCCVGICVKLCCVGICGAWSKEHAVLPIHVHELAITNSCLDNNKRYGCFLTPISRAE